MRELTAFLLGGCTIILIIEGMMWELFRRKITGLDFEEGADTAFFKFFTLGHVSLIVFLHTALLLTTIIFAFITLW